MTGNLCFEEVVTRVLQENWEIHERAKERFRSMLNSSCHQWARLTQELDKLSQEIEAATDRKLHKQTEERMGVLRTALKKVETSIAKSKDHLEESQMREEEAPQEDQGQSDSSEEKDGDVVVEGAKGSGPAGAEAVALSEVKKQSLLWRWMWVTSHHLPLRVQQMSPPKEDEMLMGDPTSVAGEMAQLQVAPPDSHKPEDGETL